MHIPIRAVVADDHDVVRAGLSELLDDDPEITVVGECADACATLQFLSEQQPDVLVLDLQIPGMTCVDIMRHAKSACPALRILVLTLWSDEAYVFALLKAGADGCLTKQADSEELVHAVKRLATGHEVMEMP